MLATTGNRWLDNCNIICNENEQRTQWIRKFAWKSKKHAMTTITHKKFSLKTTTWFFSSMQFFNVSNSVYDEKCPGNDAKLIRCVLGMTLNSSVVVQGMTVKLRPCLRFRACGWGCVRWKAPCRKGCGWFVELTWLALLSLYYIL